MLKTPSNKDGDRTKRTPATDIDHRPRLTGITPVIFALIAIMVAAFGPAVLAQVVANNNDGQRAPLEQVSGPEFISSDNHLVSWTGHDCARHLGDHPAITQFSCDGVTIESRAIESVADTDEAIVRIARAKLQSNEINKTAIKISDDPLVWRGGFNITPGCTTNMGVCLVSAPVLIAAGGHDIAADGSITDGPIAGVAVVFSETVPTGENYRVSKEHIDNAITELSDTVRVEEGEE